MDRKKEMRQNWEEIQKASEGSSLANLLTKARGMLQKSKELSEGSFESKFWDVDIYKIYDGKTKQLYTFENTRSKRESFSDDSLGFIVFKIDKVDQYFSNTIGTVHGGALATFVDCLTSCALFAFDAKNRPFAVSLNLTVDYLNEGPIGQALYFKCNIEKIAKNVGFTSCQISTKNGKMVASGKHIKAFINPP